MFDEYGQIGGCDHSARLDNFAIALQNDPTVTGFVMIYGPEGENWGTGKGQFAIINDYLVNSRGLAGERIRFIYGGRNEDLTQPKIQLWLAPPDAEPPEPQRYETTIRTFSGKFIEYEAWDVSSVEYFAEGEGSPPVGGVTLSSFADMLSQQTKATAYVVAYNGAEAVPGAWRRVAQRDVDRLRELGVEPDRVKLIYGGRSKKTNVQLWILPKTARPPVSDAGPEAPPEKAVQMETFSDYQLGSDENQQHALNDLLGVLRLNENLRVCLIVRLESLAPAKAEEAETNTSIETESAVAPAPDVTEPAKGTADEIVESPPADFQALVQKWMVELAAHKIAADRLVVLYVPTQEFEGNTLETWIVPAGLPLPDPLAEPKEIEDEKEESADSRKPPLKPAK